jgi:hypothetical protein
MEEQIKMDRLLSFNSLLGLIRRITSSIERVCWMNYRMRSKNMMHLNMNKMNSIKCSLKIELSLTILFKRCHNHLYLNPLKTLAKAALIHPHSYQKEELLLKGSRKMSTQLQVKSSLIRTKIAMNLLRTLILI